MEGSDVCFAPVLDPWEAPLHPHLKSRGTFVESFGILQPAPAPRFSRTSAQITGAPPVPGEHTDQVLLDWGFSRSDIDELRRAQVLGAAPAAG